MPPIQPPGQLPADSSLVAQLRSDGRVPSDAIVIRGYLGTSDLIDRISDILNSLQRAVNDPVRLGLLESDITLALPRRLYLTPSLDRYVEFHRDDVIAWSQEGAPSRSSASNLRGYSSTAGDAFTFWLRPRPADEPPYCVVESRPLEPGGRWLSGELVEDRLAANSGAGQAWDDSLLGPPTSKGRSGLGCI